MSDSVDTPTLVALTPGVLLPGGAVAAGALVMRVAAAAGAGLRGVLLREPALPDGELLALARRLRDVLDRVGGWLAVHDRVHVARAAGADGAHLGFRSLAPGEARRALGDGRTLGLSTHLADAPAPAPEVDYVFFGPVRETPSKRGLVEPVGVETLAARVAASPVPVWALGGLGPEDAEPVLAAGARGIAALGGLLGAEDPAAATARYLEAIARWA